MFILHKQRAKRVNIGKGLHKLCCLILVFRLEKGQIVLHTK
ncbi:hypothetical protein HPHPP3B_0509 [Helicobacter pylori Hp P-3b]|nr:hypothetical protein HPHPP3B_0509 [Helicobacter pylori Hp P-3b]